MAFSHPEPAYRLYPLGRGWHVLGSTLSGLLMRSRLLAARWLDHAASLRYLASLYFWPLRSLAWLATAGFFAAAALQYLPHLLLALAFLLLYPPILLIWLALNLLTLVLLRSIDACYHLLNALTYRCSMCYKKMARPAHLCPSCGVEHTRLYPSFYGVLWHRCKGCETHLPTLDLLGRKRLSRVCPHCHRPLSKSFGAGPAIHVALLGAPLSGKTTYLAATLQALQQHPSSQIRVTSLDSVQSTLEGTLSESVTARQEEVEASLAPQAHLLGLRSSHTWLTRCLYLYDPPTRALQSDAAASQQGYYSCCDGIIFVIDPFAIPAYFQQHQREIEALGLPCRPNALEVTRVYERVMRLLEISSGLHKKKRYPHSVAVVLTKVDALGKPASALLPGANPATVREFLCAYGLDNLVRDIEAHFAHVRYFSCSPQEDLSRVRSTALLAPLLWLLAQNNMIT